MLFAAFNFRSICLVLLVSHHFTRVPVRVTQRDITVQVDFVVVTDEFKNGDMKSAGERHTILCHANGVVLRVGTPENGDKSLQLHVHFF